MSSRSRSGRFITANDGRFRRRNMSIGLMRVWRDGSRLITVPWQTIMIFEHRSRRLLIQQRRRNVHPPGLQILFRRSVCWGSRRICRWLHETVGGLSETVHCRGGVLRGQEACLEALPDFSPIALLCPQPWTQRWSRATQADIVSVVEREDDSDDGLHHLTATDSLASQESYPARNV